MKSYTDLEQSKKLQEILPLESADMYYQYVLPKKSDKIRYNPILGSPIEALEWYNKGYTHFGKEPLSLKEYCIPCWSLSALLSVLPDPILTQFSEDKWNVAIFGKDNNFKDECFAGEPVDACYEMIVKLHLNKEGKQ